jgi:transcriptional regulator with XRE-family HTH domain
MSDLPLAFIQAARPAARLKLIRTLRGLSQKELEQRAGLPATTLSHIEAGRRIPDPATRARLALALDADVEAVFPDGLSGAA